MWSRKRLLPDCRCVRDVGDVRQRLANVEPSKLTGDTAEEIGESR